MVEDSSTLQYLRQMMEMDPMGPSPSILALRRQFLEAPESCFDKSNTSLSEVELRNQAVVRVDTLRDEFWLLDDQTLKVRLATLNVARFPDLALAANRMGAVADRRASFESLGLHPENLPEFFEAFSRVVIASPSRVTQVRTEEIARAIDERRFPRSRSDHERTRFVRVIQDEFPELYVLDTPWLRHVEPRRGPIRLSEIAAGWLAGALLAIFGVAAVLASRLALSMIRSTF